MTALVSTLMIAIGFMNGMIVSSVLNSFHNAHLKSMLDKAIDLKFEADKRIDELEEEIRLEKADKNKLIDTLRNAVSQYQELPPPGPAERSDNYCESCSEDEEFDCPISPDLNPNNKE